MTAHKNLPPLSSASGHEIFDDRLVHGILSVLQPQAVMLGRPLIYLAPEEAVKMNGRSGPDATQICRTWDLWKQRTLGAMMGELTRDSFGQG